MGGWFIIYYSSLRNEDNKWHMYWDMIKRFSPWATGAVIVILITGLFNSTFLFQQSTRYLIRSMDWLY